MSEFNNSLTFISFQDAYLEYKGQKLNEERLHTRGQNDFELVKKVLCGFDVDLIDTSKENIPPEIKVSASKIT